MGRLTRYRNTVSPPCRGAGMQCDASQKTLPFTDNSEYVLNNANSEE